MISQILKGASHVRDGFKLIKLRGVKRYVVIPVLINFIIFIGAIWYLYIKFDSLLEQFLPSWLDWLEFLIWPLFFIACLLVVFFAFTIVANVFGAPFNGVLSEKIEQKLSNEKLDLNDSSNEGYLSLLRGARIGISNEFRKLFYIAIRAIPLLLLFLIPGINFFAPFIWFLFAAWMFAIEYLDYPMGNRNLTFKQQLTIIKHNRFLCLGMGIALMVMTIIPGLNFFAMPVGVAAATSLWSKHLKQHAPAIENKTK
ncbi:MAG: sulfate transporter CysZ [Gammaproteobacteria bacterium]|nr:MAG: sulfate transporter CysZ [Gammaproteobacteria bacterium]QMU62665.1 MAG: sulfate transporter CysZ [Gammaproteobacteria bacterium]